MKNNGVLFIISGPSGCGKGTIVNQLIERNSDIFISVSATTRQPRAGEVDGKSYHFITAEEFDRLASNDGFLEYAGYCENRYGTPKKAVDDAMQSGRDVILEIEVQGALQVKAKRPDAVLIFILPPSVEELERRLRKRASETEDKVQKRLAKANDEMKLVGLYDYSVVNDALEDAVVDVESIMRAEHLRN